MKKSILIILAALSVCNSAAAITVYDPTNHTENLATKLQMIEQVKNSAQQLQNDIKNLQKLDPSNLNASLSRIEATINTMAKIRAQTDAIGSEYSHLMTEWDEINPDYDDWNGISAVRYAEQTKKLRNKWSKSLQQALGMTGIASSSEQQKTEASVQQLLNASQNAEGTMGALQAANQLTAIMISEQQKLQSLMADSMRSQNMYYQMMIDGEKQAAQLNKEFMKNREKYRNATLKGNGEPLTHFRE